jgi:pimeloyl-ACP methyl ester carboxylesterase
MVGVAFATRYPDRCRTLITISAGLRPDGWGKPPATCSASSCATACGTAT